MPSRSPSARRPTHLGPLPGRRAGRGGIRLVLSGLSVVLATSCRADDRSLVDPQATSPASLAAPGPSPCGLITPSEAGTYLGSPIGTPQAEAGRCTLPASDGQGFVAVTVDTSGEARTMLEATRASDKGEAVDGIGEAAYLALPGNDLGVVAFVEGQVRVSILVRSPARDRAALLKLAGVAAQRT